LIDDIHIFINVNQNAHYLLIFLLDSDVLVARGLFIVRSISLMEEEANLSFINILLLFFFSLLSLFLCLEIDVGDAELPIMVKGYLLEVEG
jgi:hypothetical protein